MAALYTAGDVMDTAAALMNDSSKTLFTYTVQLPYLRMANKQLDQELNLNECPLNLISEYETVVLAGALHPSLPTSFFLPISLKERKNGDTLEIDYANMIECSNVYDLSLEPSSALNYWDWRHNCINFIGATENREVRIYYWREATIPSDSGGIELQAGASNFLAYKTAAHCARYIRKQAELADYLDAEANKSIDLLISVLVKNHQALRVRRKPFRAGNRVGTYGSR